MHGATARIAKKNVHNKLGQKCHRTVVYNWKWQEVDYFKNNVFVHASSVEDISGFGPWESLDE